MFKQYGNKVRHYRKVPWGLQWQYPSLHDCKNTTLQHPDIAAVFQFSMLDMFKKKQLHHPSLHLFVTHIATLHKCDLCSNHESSSAQHCIVVYSIWSKTAWVCEKALGLLVISVGIGFHKLTVPHMTNLQMWHETNIQFGKQIPTMIMHNPIRSYFANAKWCIPSL